MFSKFFIERPIFATVLALLFVVAGLVTLNILPVAQYPDITPPTVQVSAVYPGANAETVAQTVGIPIEQQVNGVDGMLYMSSNSSASGAYSLTVTFEVGTDIDMATVMVQNRVSVALNSLPEAVKVQGVTVQKQSSNIVMMLTLSGDSIYDGLYLTNYANLNLVDQLTRVPGVGAVNVMGAGDYSMRVWLNPETMRIHVFRKLIFYRHIKFSRETILAIRTYTVKYNTVFIIGNLSHFPELFFKSVRTAVKIIVILILNKNYFFTIDREFRTADAVSVSADG